MQLPKYYPIASESHRSFEELKPDLQDNELLESTEQQILGTAKSYIDDLVSNDAVDIDLANLQSLSELIKAYEQLKGSQVDANFFKNAFKLSKDTVRNLSRHEPELSVRNLDQFIGESEDRNFSKLLETELNSGANSRESQDYRKSESYLYLKNAIFVLGNPEKPLPNFEENDDDIEIEGGIVDLKCPITLQQFKNPFVSKICGHTYDWEGIRGTWINPQMTVNCPTPGCVATLRLEDFMRDDLMSLRLKAVFRQQKHHTKDVGVERI